MTHVERSRTAKAVSVSQDGSPDGWQPAPGYQAQRDHLGGTRLLVLPEPARLPDVHHALVGVLGPTVGFLYRQKVDRVDPKPQGWAGRDFVGLELSANRVLAALVAAGDLVYGDARCEVWIRGPLGDQVVLDQDGALFCYPFDPAFQTVAEKMGLHQADELETLAQRDYVKAWFHAHCDALEEQLLTDLGLAEIPVRS